MSIKLVPMILQQYSETCINLGHSKLQAYCLNLLAALPNVVFVKILPFLLNIADSIIFKN
jgi:hypothetical protein